MSYSPQIMGILNITPDSFYDGNKYSSSEDILSNIQELKKSDIVDVGCESSRPGSKPITIEEELKRLDKFIPLIKHFNDTVLSIDTYKSEVAEYGIKHGFTIINDITAGRHSNKMFDLVRNNNVQIILMHMQGKPSNMQSNPTYIDLIDDITSFFEDRISEALKRGVKENQILIDPGIGFGKTFNDNIKIIKNIKTFKKLGFKVLLGHSRKAFLQHDNNLPKNRLAASIGVSAYAAIQGVDILRVHDVNETIDMLKTINKLMA